MGLLQGVGMEFQGDLGVGSHRTLPRIFLSVLNVLLWPLSPVLEALSVLVNNPDVGEPVRLELADLLTLDSERFHRTAEEFTLQFGEPRPS